MAEVVCRSSRQIRNT